MTDEQLLNMRNTAENICFNANDLKAAFSYKKENRIVENNIIRLNCDIESAINSLIDLRSQLEDIIQ